MKGITITYAAFMVFISSLVFFMLLTPVLAFQKNPLADFLYDSVYSNLCHQKISRSLCLFQNSDGYHIWDCLPQNGVFRADSRAEKMAYHDGAIGYKFPVSARDMAIYIGMLIGGIALFLAGKSDSNEVPPATWFLLALVPIAIDGTTQTIFMMRESTNLLRIITGFIAGFATGIYGPLVLNKIFEIRKNEVKL